MAIDKGYVNTYKRIKKVDNIKYSGFHPIEKKDFIKRINIKIDNFNKYWTQLVPKFITEEIDMYEDDSKLKNLARKNKLNISEDGFRETIFNGEIDILQTDVDEVFMELSEISKKKFKPLIKRITETEPNKKLYESIKKKGGKKIFKGGKCEEFDKCSQDLELNLGIPTDTDGKIIINSNPLIKDSPMKDSIREKIERLFAAKLLIVARGEKNKEKKEKKN